MTRPCTYVETCVDANILMSTFIRFPRARLRPNLSR